MPSARKQAGTACLAISPSLCCAVVLDHKPLLRASAKSFPVTLRNFAATTTHPGTLPGLSLASFKFKSERLQLGSTVICPCVRRTYPDVSGPYDAPPITSQPIPVSRTTCAFAQLILDTSVTEPEPLTKPHYDHTFSATQAKWTVSVQPCSADPSTVNRSDNTLSLPDTTYRHSVPFAASSLVSNQFGVHPRWSRFMESISAG